jgi:hypothetical protein
MIPSMLKLPSKNLEARKEYRANLNLAQFLKSATDPSEVLKSNKPWAVQYYSERITLPETDSLKVNRIVLSISSELPEPRTLSDKQIVFQNDYWKVYEVKH